MPSNIQENLPVAFAMLEEMPDKWKLEVFSKGTAEHLTDFFTEGLMV